MNVAQLINGKELAEKLQQETAQQVETLAAKGIHPGLVVLLVGENPASQIYVRNKERAAKKIGIHSEVKRYPETNTQAKLMVQLPLPEHIDEEKILLSINPLKDVDGFHPMNMGRLFAGMPHTIPCTPYGIMKMFEEYNIPLAGKQAVVIGRSNIVGKPMAILLLGADSTVTLTHSKTEDLAKVASKADILVVAIGRGHFVTKEFIKPGAVVIDVGMNRNEDGKLIGDVKFDEVEPIASYITPVPGGVGPMTITMLMQQTVECCERQVLDHE